jgi:hypothetical protein
MAVDRGGKTTIINFEKQTIVVIDPASKTYSVNKLPNSGDSRISSVTADNAELALVKVVEPGQTKDVNGFATHEVVLTVLGKVNLTGGMAIVVQFENDTWVVSNVQGWDEMHAFFRDHAANFPWAALVPKASPEMQDTLARTYGLMAQSVGAMVHSITRVTVPPNVELIVPPQTDPAREAQMRRSFQSMREMLKQVGIRGVLLETTLDSSEFSDAKLPDYIFEVPAGYTLRP